MVLKACVRNPPLMSQEQDEQAEAMSERKDECQFQKKGQRKHHVSIS